MKKKWLALALGLSLTATLAACGGGEEEKASEDTKASAGEEIFKKNCISCHGENLEGGVGPELTKVGAKMSKDDIAKIIKEGKGAMPKGLVADSDADEVAGWLAEKK